MLTLESAKAYVHAYFRDGYESDARIDAAVEYQQDGVDCVRICFAHPIAGQGDFDIWTLPDGTLYGEW